MPQQSELSDLNPYERERLANIQRNEEFLRTIGIATIIPPATRINKPEEHLKERKRKVVSALEEGLSSSSSSSKKGRREDAAAPPPRRSLRGKNGTLPLQAAPPSPPPPPPRGYADMPEESGDLDDHEFQVFAMLKAWRLKTCRALNIEPYKVFQNRTLCEIIRRRRNNPTWGTANFAPELSVLHQRLPTSSLNPGAKEGAAASKVGVVIGKNIEKGREKEAVQPLDDDTESTTEAKAGDDENDDKEEEEEEKKEEMGEKEREEQEALWELQRGYSVADQLMMCWGVGPGKVREHKDLPGFAFGAINVLDESIASTATTTVTTPIKSETTKSAGTNGETADITSTKETRSIAELLQLSREHPQTDFI